MGYVIFIGIIVVTLYLMRWVMNILMQKIRYPWLSLLLTLIIGAIILIGLGFIAFIFGLSGYFGNALPPTL